MTELRQSRKRTIVTTQSLRRQPTDRPTVDRTVTSHHFLSPSSGDAVVVLAAIRSSALTAR